jgi:hypothetical protein
VASKSHSEEMKVGAKKVVPQGSSDMFESTDEIIHN